MNVGQALNTSNSDFNNDVLHENSRGILLAETSGLTSTELEFVLVTSGMTGVEVIALATAGNFPTLWKPSVNDVATLCGSIGQF